MEIMLKPLDKGNPDARIDLEIWPEQAHFVGSTSFLVKEQDISPSVELFSICQGQNTIGFVMFTKREFEDGIHYYVNQLIIDKRYQRQGFGKAAMKQIIILLKKRLSCSEIRISYDDDNIAAERLYLDLGFQKIGRIDRNFKHVDEGGEILLSLAIK